MKPHTALLSIAVLALSATNAYAREPGEMVRECMDFAENFYKNAKASDPSFKYIVGSPTMRTLLEVTDIRIPVTTWSGDRPIQRDYQCSYARGRLETLTNLPPNQ